eukprot:scaffold42443_cov33-Tisochrysis_lutea.AAC.6
MRRVPSVRWPLQIAAGSHRLGSAQDKAHGSLPIRRVDIGLGVEKEADQLNIAAREGMMEWGAAAAVLPVVWVGARVEKTFGDLQPRATVGLQLPVACGHLVQSAVEESLGHACGHQPAVHVSGRAEGGWRGERAAGPSRSICSIASTSRHRIAQIKLDSSSSSS